MNAPVPIEPSLRSAHFEALEAANKWRGRCVNQFARGERLISQALHSAGEGAKLPKMVGQRCDQLSKLVNEDVREAIEAFRGLSGRRNAIVHGEGRVYIDQRGQWLLKLVHHDSDGPVESTVGQESADALYCNVKATVQRLKAKLET